MYFLVEEAIYGIYEFFMNAAEDPGEIAPVHMTFVGTGWNGQWYPNANLIDRGCKQVDSPFGDYKVKNVCYIILLYGQE